MASTEAEPKAVEETDGSTTTSNETSNDVKHVKKIMTEKVEGGKSAWAMTLETLRMWDGGKRKKGDIICDNFDEALTKFRDMTKETSWQYTWTPFDDFNATEENLLKGFVHWSQKGDEDGRQAYNISKAFRRLESYVEWMEKNCKELNLKGSSMKEIQDVWKMKMTHDKNGRLVCWIDIGDLDLKYIKKSLPHEDTLRYVVWLSHLVLFDTSSQENGLVFAEAMGHKGMIECITAISMDVGTKLDRLTIGILPVKMEACYLFNNPTWLHIIMGLISPFMGKKMRKRIKTFKKKEDHRAFFEEHIGKDHIPADFAGLSGAAEKDILGEALARLS